MKKRWIVGAMVVLVLGVLIATRGDEDAAPATETARAVRGEVRNEVSVTGHVKPLERIDLAFIVGGRVETVEAVEDAPIAEGDVIARLATDGPETQVREAEARLLRERALETDLLAPLRTEERAVKDAAVMSAEGALARAEDSARATLARAYVYADDAIREEADELFYGSRGVHPKFGTNFTYGTTEFALTADAQTRTALTSARAVVEEALVRLAEREKRVDGDIQTLLMETDADLRVIETFLNDLARAVNRYIPTDTSAQAVYESYQTSVASARTALLTARSDVLAAQKEHQTAYTALAGVLRDLELSLAGASSDALAAQRAAVILAEHGVSLALNNLNEAVLRAPFAGVVTNLSLERGAVVTAYTPVGQLMADAGFELEAYVPEADIATVKLGDTARVTYDAFERTDVFSAKVVRISLSETMREGVPTYRTTLITTEAPPTELTVRSGMTADIDIVTDVRTDVIAVPSRSVVSESGRTFVRVQTGDGLEQRIVITGLRGSDGMTEIVSGITEGEEIVLFIEEP